MKKMSFILILAMAAACLCFSGCGYNTMQKLEENVFEALGNIESSCQRRFDLIPNLVNVVRAYAAHEKETLTAVIEARSKAGRVNIDANDAAAISKFAAAQGELSSALSRLMVIIEKYPDLKANEMFLGLQTQLEGTENRINVARDRYNQAVRLFNSSIRAFPNNLTNSFLLHLKPKTYFEAASEAKEAPAVKM